MIKMTDTQSITGGKELGLNKRLADISAATSVISAFLVVIAFLFSSEWSAVTDPDCWWRPNSPSDRKLFRRSPTL